MMTCRASAARGVRAHPGVFDARPELTTGGLHGAGTHRPALGSVGGVIHCVLVFLEVEDMRPEGLGRRLAGQIAQVLGLRGEAGGFGPQQGDDLLHLPVPQQAAQTVEVTLALALVRRAFALDQFGAFGQPLSRSGRNR